MKNLWIILLSVLLTGCSKLTPSGFWTDYHSDSIVRKFSDQGPWGGVRNIIWESDTSISSTKELLDFASQNDWDLTNKISFPSDKERLHNFNIDDYSIYLLEEHVVSNWKDQDFEVFIFRTGWVAIEPGNIRETEKNGFLVINSDRSKIEVFHLWGE